MFFFFFVGGFKGLFVCNNIYMGFKREIEEQWLRRGNAEKDKDAIFFFLMK